MPTLSDLTLLAPDGSGTPWDRVIPEGAKVGDVVALIGGVSPAIPPYAPSFRFTDPRNAFLTGAML